MRRIDALCGVDGVVTCPLLRGGRRPRGVVFFGACVLSVVCPRCVSSGGVPGLYVNGAASKWSTKKWVTTTASAHGVT